MTVSPALRLLAIESSTDTLSVAVGTGGPGAVPASYAGAGAAQASTTLLPAAQTLLAQAGWALSTLDAVVFGRGPGAFTGLRTACAVAQGLAYGARAGQPEAPGLPVLPVDTLLALAEEARWQRSQIADAPPMTLVAALLDARMDEIYAALYAVDGEQLRAIAAPVLVAPEALGDWLAGHGAPASGQGLWLAGNALAAYGERLQAVPGERLVVLPTAGALLRLAPGLLTQGLAVPAAQALPLYVRDKVARTTEERERAGAQR